MTDPGAVGQPELYGEHTGLRRWVPSDLDVVLDVSEDPLIPLISEVPADRDRRAALAFVEAQDERIDRGLGWAWAVVPRGHDEVVGYVGALWVAQAAGRASVGYWTSPAGRRRGLTADAVATASAWLLADAGVARLEAYVEPWNEGSVRVAERAGYQREGLMRSFAPIAGRRRDAYLYARVAP